MRKLKTAKSSYQSGHTTGKNWKENYRPGGPWFMLPNPRDDEDFQAHCSRMVENNREYLRGFDNGFATQA